MQICIYFEPVQVFPGDGRQREPEPGQERVHEGHQGVRADQLAGGNCARAVCQVRQERRLHCQLRRVHHCHQSEHEKNRISHK